MMSDSAPSAPDWEQINAERVAVGLPPVTPAMSTAELCADAEARWDRLCEVMAELRS